MSSNDRFVRADAASLLGLIGEPALPDLWHLADSTEAVVAEAGVRALAIHAGRASRSRRRPRC